MKLRKLLMSAVLVIVLSILCSGSVLAVSKPIAGYVFSDDSNPAISIFVEVEGALGKQTCSVFPPPTVGYDNSFSTNLANLRLVNNPTVDCSGWWAKGNNLWIVVKSLGEEFSSPAVLIEPGTGLQWLDSFSTFDQNEDQKIDIPSSEGGYGPIPPIPVEEVTFSFDYSFDEQSGELSTNSLFSKKGGEHKVATLSILLFKYSSSEITTLLEKEIVLSDLEDNHSQIFSLNDLDDGIYTLQGFIMEGETILKASPSYRISKSKIIAPLPVEEKPVQIKQPVTAPQKNSDFMLGFLLLTLSIILNIGVFLAILKKKKKKSQKRKK